MKLKNKKLYEPIRNAQGFLEPVESTRRDFKCFVMWRPALGRIFENT